MSSHHYKPENGAFDKRLAQRADELKRGEAVTDRAGRVVVLELGPLTFSSPEDAIRFLRRVAQSTRRTR